MSLPDPDRFVRRSVSSPSLSSWQTAVSGRSAAMAGLLLWLWGCAPSLVETGELSTRADDAGTSLCVDGETTMRVLFLGNSYTARHGGLDVIVQELAANLADCPRTLDVSAHAPGGRQLVQHAADALTEGTTVQQLLHDDRGWDVVVLQEQSQIPGFPAGDATQEASIAAVRDTLVPLIDAAGARLVMLLTWGYRDGDERNPELYPDYPTMQSRLVAGMDRYEAAATAASSRVVTVAPAGLAFAALHDASPGVGGGERFRSLYDEDGSHPSPRGSYLAAATVLHTLLGQRSAVSTAHPGISAADKAWLDDAAQRGSACWGSDATRAACE